VESFHVSLPRGLFELKKHQRGQTNDRRKNKIEKYLKGTAATGQKKTHLEKRPKMYYI
jgi:hypothetical protein